MKIVEINKKDYNSYKDFYIDIFKKLDGKDNIDFEDMEDLLYSADVLNEFLWYNHDVNINFIFKNFDLEKIRNYKNYDNYEWSIIIKVFRRFSERYPNNTLEFVNEE